MMSDIHIRKKCLCTLLNDQPAAVSCGFICLFFINQEFYQRLATCMTSRICDCHTPPESKLKDE